MGRNTLCSLALLLFALLVALPALAYEYPLSTTAIRDAYFLGTGPKSAEADFYEPYSRTFSTLPKEAPTSVITIDTPYLQIAEHARQTPNYHAQDAVKDFFGKPAQFRVFLDVYFTRPLEKSDNSENKTLHGLDIKLTQNHKVIVMQVVDSWDLYPFRDAQTSVESAGEHVELSCDARSVDSSPLKIEVKTPNAQIFEVKFDLENLR